MRVCIIGAGIIGACVARHLARKGIDVTVLDAGGASASAASFGWINASFFANPAHHALRAEGLAAWGRLRDAVPNVPIKVCGAVSWEAQGAALDQMAADLTDLGYDHEVWGGKMLRAAEPDVLADPERTLVFPQEMAADSAGVARAVLEASGARVVRGVRALGILGADAVTGVDTSLGRIAADHVVVAAGTGAEAVLATCGVRLPMLTRPGVLVRTTPVEARIGRILVTDHGEVRQLPCGRLLASAVANHQGDEADTVVETPDEIATRVLEWLSPLVRGGVSGWDQVRLGYRPMPADGLPVIGAAGPKGLHVAVMHSGVTLAAVVGEILAAQITGQATNAQAHLVAPFDAGRF
ncbi:NAD(P)/FAD-dependent oxidoreductase [Pseudooctadecabacter jejudonensis]|uniref:D-amino acid dehydrogenase small subunit n=1 Tax=Pseudooctadecabacter jejudonensis TaxID=1391910 RepID=A0A1Y5RHK6_9RHOB|nr:FAD-dependent oxidoreductase [Pseudooctadecabacter jejudonensis]SLN17310.1 D-amino acid dehydrogenase small subunit [Pseudooctadecabacter jejudonensis]